jgi:hypothetical protein
MEELVVSRPALRWIARIGFLGRGIVFLILGGLALWAALGGGTQPVGTSGALNRVISQPAGALLALAIAIGLLCFAALRVVEAVSDVYDYGDDWHGLAQRASLGAAGVFYTALGIAAASIVLAGRYAPNNDQQVRDWTAWALRMPFGAWLVGIAGAIIVAVGLGLAIAGLRGKFKTRLRLHEKGGRFVTVLGVIGFLARSVVFVMIGSFLIFAAFSADPNQAQGFGGALRALRDQPYGDLLLFTAAAGLLAFGIFGVAEAHYGRATRLGTVP